MGARNRVGIGLSYRPSASYVGGIDFLESISGLFKSSKIRAQQSTWAGRIDSLESIPGLHKSLKIRALYICYRSSRQINLCSLQLCLSSATPDTARLFAELVGVAYPFIDKKQNDVRIKF
jgi:hypothetical protein